MLVAAVASVRAQDIYEPDDEAGLASYLEVGDVQSNHNFHVTNDTDWVRFFLLTNTPYTIRGRQNATNVNLRLNLYREDPGGLVHLITNRSFTGLGLGTNETIQVTNTLSRFYLLRVDSSTVSGGWGPDTDYSVEVTESTGGGRLVVVAYDVLTDAAPAGARAILDGGDFRDFNGALSVSFDSVSTGAHSVVVTAAPGYVRMPSESAAGQEDNPGNTQYGNPRNKTVRNSVTSQAIFLFVPVVGVQGTVRDAATGEPVTNARIAFVATTGSYTNPVFDAWPENTTYQQAWRTDSQGRFPANVWLPTRNWDLQLSRNGYSDHWTIPALTSPVRGTTNQLQVKWMAPVDANGNGIGDAWEVQYLGGLTNATLDPDGDGVNLWEEYVAGTDPTNAASVLESEATLADGQWVIRWSAVSGRVYRVRSNSELVAGAWSVVGGPWTSVVSGIMSYTNAPADPNAVLRVDVGAQ